MTHDEIALLGQKVWDYHLLHQPLQKCDAILVLGSQDLRVAEWGSQLWIDGWAPLLIFSGGFGRLTKSSQSKSEASVFAEIAINMGVPEEVILLEEHSANTGENIRFTKQLLEEKGIHTKRLLLVQKPYMERRTFATFIRQWPGQEICVSSPPITFNKYPTADIPFEKLLNMMTGDLQRIKLYAENGFQAPQVIPASVWEAYEKLVALGFDRQLIRP